MSHRADLIITPRYILSNIVCNRIYDGVVILPYGLKLWAEYIHEYGGLLYIRLCVYVLRVSVHVCASTVWFFFSEKGQARQHFSKFKRLMNSSTI